MKPFVMFGTHPLFGDYADAIHACGGFVSRIVQNVPEPPRAAGQRLEDRLARYHAWLDQQKIRHRVQLVALEDFAPREDEAYLFGFRGPKLLPLRDHLKERFQLSFAPLVHPSAAVSPMAVLREGIFVGAGTVIAPHAEIGEFTLVNRGATIGHDGVIGSCVIIGPSAAIASSVRLERGAVVGIGATIIENLTVGEGSYVAAGAVALKDVPPHTMVAGVPAVEKKSLMPS
jgi:sugar O-acyltransferase (sialic acid O-acetyltransferase NeuD family)